MLAHAAALETKMWTLFTTALARGNSTTQVSIMNTSANFVITAVLGFAIFSESLPPLWWAGAALLVVGNVIIGRKVEGAERTGDKGGDDEEERIGSGSPSHPPTPELRVEVNDVIGEAALLAEEVHAAAKLAAVVAEEVKDDDGDILDLGLEEEAGT